MALPVHALGAVQAKLKSVSNEGQFTIDATTLSRPYFTLHCIRVTEIHHKTLPAHLETNLETNKLWTPCYNSAKPTIRN
jgi:hypothetical protein